MSFTVISILKWMATAILLVGSLVNGLGYYPLGPAILAIGGSLWLVVSIVWRDWSLIATNGMMTVLTVVPLMWSTYA